MFVYHALKVVGVGVTLLLFSTAPAYAYLDPGTTSKILQVLISVFVGAAVAIKIYWNKVKDFISGFQKSNEEKNE